MIGSITRFIDEISDTGPIPSRRTRDWVLAGALVAVTAVELVLDPDQLPWLRLAVAAATASFVPFRHRLPLAGGLAACFFAWCLEIPPLAAGLDGEATAGQILAAAVLLYALCRWGRPHRVAIGITVLFVTIFAIEAIEEGASMAANAMLVVPWFLQGLFALSMRYRAAMFVQRDNRVRVAERNALARDVHDSVAHHVSAIAVQAQAARYVPGTLRDLVDPDGRPAVVLTDDDDLTRLPASVATGLYRLAQESITNARRHSRQVTRIEVALRRYARRVELEVLNDGIPITGRRSGYGLLGMGERAAVLGGTVTAGPRSESGWRVHASLPIEAGPGARRETQRDARR